MNKYNTKKLGSFVIIILLLTTIFSTVAISTIQNDDINIQKHERKNSFIDAIIPKRRGKTIVDQIPFLESTITTNCGTIEKTYQITFGQFNELDVDNNENTGMNGKDIRIQYLILPWLETQTSIQIGLRFLLTIERIGDEIKSHSFTLSSNMFDGMMHLGYQSPKTNQNEIPSFLQLSSFIFFKPETGTSGISFEMNPQYDSSNQDHKLTFFTTYQNGAITQSYEFMFEPVSNKQITIESTKSQGIFQYSITKGNTLPTTASIKIMKTTDDTPIETNLIIDPLPSDVTFSLGITPFSKGGGVIEYQSNSYYDTSILIESNNMGSVKYAVVKNTPKYFYAEWDPSKENGYYHLNIDATDTDMFLLDSLSQPTINLSIQDIEVIEFSAFWNLTDPGDFTIIKDTSFHIDLDFIIDEWEARIDAEPTAENIKITWLTDVSGYFSFDTDSIPLNTIDMLIKGSDLGIRTQGEFVKADDFMLEWTIWPPIDWNIDKSGTIDFHSMSIDLFLDGIWYHLWPWI